MNREKENNEIIEHIIIKETEKGEAGTFEEIALFYLGAIALVLSDISKSLAIIADNAEGKDSRFESEAADDREQ